MDKESRIYVAGHNGMVGSAIVRKLRAAGFDNLLLKRSSEIDLRNQANVEGLFKEHKPSAVIFAAARVGGIQANINYPADFLYDNLAIQNNVIQSSYLNDVEKFVFLGSSCRSL